MKCSLLNLDASFPSCSLIPVKILYVSLKIEHPEASPVFVGWTNPRCTEEWVSPSLWSYQFEFCLATQVQNGSGPPQAGFSENQNWLHLGVPCVILSLLSPIILCRACRSLPDPLLLSLLNDLLLN